ncbi:hypothetical protein AAG570_012439 [Ranatra chinensis]|uniref:Uncharacterized protein n=1 Tax=Ranatra chinensis TaxID=642074 RepID=A0ABD0Z244_9HEMI
MPDGGGGNGVAGTAPPPRALGRQGASAERGATEKLDEFGWEISRGARPTGERFGAGPCLHYPGLNSAEGGIGGWDSLPSPNDPGTDGRAAVPTSADASTPRRRDSGHSSAPRKARTSEYRYTGDIESKLVCGDIVESMAITIRNRQSATTLSVSLVWVIRKV